MTGHDELENMRIYFFFFHQSLRQTSLFTVSGDKLDLLFSTIWPAKEKSLSHGTVVAGVPKYLRAMWAILP